MVGRRAARRTTGEDDVEMNEAQPPKARKMTHAPLDYPRRDAGGKRKAIPRDRKRNRSHLQEDGDDADRSNRRPVHRAPQGPHTHAIAPAGPASIPPQDLSVGGNVPPEGRLGGLSIAGPAGTPTPPAR